MPLLLKDRSRLRVWWPWDFLLCFEAFVAFISCNNFNWPKELLKAAAAVGRWTQESGYHYWKKAETKDIGASTLIRRKFHRKDEPHN
jgi:hypothetical protein